MKILLPLVLLTLAATLWSFYRGVSVPAAEIPLHRVEQSTLLDSIDATGVIRAQTGAEVRVGSRLSGMLEKLHVDVGDKVRAGQLLAELDARELRSEAAAAEAAVEESRARLALSRLLLDKNQRSAGLAPAELATLEMEVIVNEARLGQAQAQLELLRIRLSHTRVLAPIGGTVAAVSTNPGETIAASFAAPTFLTVIDLDRLEIQAYVDEADVGKVFAGQAASFSVDAWPGESFSGTVRTVHPKAEIRNNVVNYVAVIDIAPDQPRSFRPEMTAHVRLLVEEREGVLMVPRAALGGEGGVYYVLVMGAAGWEKRRVVPGLADGARIEIIEGLLADERLSADAADWRRALADQGRGE